MSDLSKATAPVGAGAGTTDWVSHLPCREVGFPPTYVGSSSGRALIAFDGHIRSLPWRSDTTLSKMAHPA